MPESWLEAAQKSPIYKLAMEWKVAFPLHPEFRTLPMVWYVPPLSPIQSQIDQGNLPTHADGVIPKLEALKIPIKFIANFLTAGKEEPIVLALKRMLAMRSYMRSVTVENNPNLAVLEEVGLSEEQVKEMYRYMAIANYEDRFVIPTGHEELKQDDFYSFQGQNGFSFGNDGNSESTQQGLSLFPEKRKASVDILKFVPNAGKSKKASKTDLPRETANSGSE